MYSVNSFSSLIACCLVWLDKQFFFGQCRNIFSGKGGSAPVEKLARTRDAHGASLPIVTLTSALYCVLVVSLWIWLLRVKTNRWLHAAPAI